VAHYTTAGTEKTAVEIDKVGKDGIKSVDGTVTHIDRGRQDHGGQDRRRHGRHISADRSRCGRCRQGIAKGTEKSAKVTVYYTEQAGKKVAHFFE